LGLDWGTDHYCCIGKRVLSVPQIWEEVNRGREYY
jgi:hypothetical protein